MFKEVLPPKNVEHFDLHAKAQRADSTPEVWFVLRGTQALFMWLAANLIPFFKSPSSIKM